MLGKVAQFYWKKEYQARGAPHYHVLLWIEGAPTIGHDSPEEVLAWIEDRITCHVPDQESNPELHRLVTRYQMHKCSNYCKRKTKIVKGKNVFVTRCKFNFPREACASSKLNPVKESLKARNMINQLARSELEVRVNDYNPLLLYVRKANIDIQFVAESSLALAHYVSGYVTKAERSNLQEIWQDVSENKSIYSRLWSFGVRSLRFRECGLYKATDLLLGDHLTEKSCTVKWVDVAMPRKRSHRLKSHRDLKQIAEHNPDSEQIFEDSLVESHYPSRPERLTDMCLYDFVAWIDWTHRDKQGEKDYRNTEGLEKLNEFKEVGRTPVCLFLTRVQCDDLNSQRLKCLPSKVKVIECTDDIDQTSTTRKWTKKATEHLEKLNKDCNMTAGLEANLHLAMGARVMLRRNIERRMG